MGWGWSTHVEIHFFVLVGIYYVCLTHDEFQFESSQAWDRFGQHMLRLILCPR